MFESFLRMCMLLYLLVIFIQKCTATADSRRGWNYINLHCRDNANSPLDWWYVYKPPDDVLPLQGGRNFSSLTRNTAGKWVPSAVQITAKSMVLNTLVPMYKRTMRDHLAVVVYSNRDVDSKTSGASAHGILMADETGGLWMTHTVPGFPDLSSDRPTFPSSELANGHLISCLSLDLDSLNAIALSLAQVAPHFSFVRIPKFLLPWIPNWDFRKAYKKSKQSYLEFVVPEGDSTKIKAAVVTRIPGDKHCIYKRFAEMKRIVLDVYGQSQGEYVTSICGRDFSVRVIDSISLNFQDEVHYIGNNTDRTWFAVSTAAAWQKLGSGPKQYWACTSSLDKDLETAHSGLLLCLNDYEIWAAFGNLKLKEPVC